MRWLVGCVVAIVGGSSAQSAVSAGVHGASCRGAGVAQ